MMHRHFWRQHLGARSVKTSNEQLLELRVPILRYARMNIDAYECHVGGAAMASDGRLYVERKRFVC